MGRCYIEANDWPDWHWVSPCTVTDNVCKVVGLTNKMIIFSLVSATLLNKCIILLCILTYVSDKSLLI